MATSIEDILSPFDRRLGLALAVISGAYSLVVAAGLAYFVLGSRHPEHFDAEPHLAMREEIATNPAAPQAGKQREEFRARDVELRREHLAANAKLQTGGWMLLVGAAVFVLSMRRLAALCRREDEKTLRPALKATPAELGTERRRSVSAAAITSVASVAAAFALVAWVRSAAGPLEVEPEPAEMVEPAPAEENVPDELKWPMFRGARGLALAPAGEYPLRWDARSGENVVWRTKVPLPGNSSPIVWGSRVFVTGGDRSARAVNAFDRRKGTLLWTSRVRTPTPGLRIEEVSEDTGLAASTPATDGLRVYAFFGTNELAAVDTSGRLLWSRWFGQPDSPFGVASSPVVLLEAPADIEKAKLYLQLDQGLKEEEHSFLYALDPATGETVWKVERKVPSSWSSPVIVRAGTGEGRGRLELVTAADPWVIAYDPATGRELWRADVLSGDVAPSPAFAGGVVFTMTEYSQLAAIRTGGSGDVTKTHVLWTYDEEASSTGSPVADGRFIVQASSYDNIVCHDAKTGEVAWMHELDERAWSSPVLAGELVYLTDAAGTTLVFPLAGKYEERGRGSVGEEVLATPAFAGGRIYLRGKGHLFCIGAKGTASTGQVDAEAEADAEDEDGAEDGQ